MSDLLIRGMEMPKDGQKLYMIAFSDGKACASYKPFEWHEVVHVPEHGRLIDADELEKDVDKYIGGEESRSRFHHWVQVQRTVIPESEEART